MYVHACVYSYGSINFNSDTIENAGNRTLTAALTGRLNGVGNRGSNENEKNYTNSPTVMNGAKIIHMQT